MRPLAIDLFTDLHGWAGGLTEAGWRVVGFDIEDMSRVLGEPKLDHFSLVIQDVLTLHGSQFRDAELIVASPPCFPAEVLVLTERGLVPISDVRVGELVFTHRNRWRRVLKTGQTVSSTVVARGYGGVLEGTWWHDPNSASRTSSSKSSARNAASAKIAKIPRTLSEWIGRVWMPHQNQPAAGGFRPPKETEMTKFKARQGDIFIERIDALPEGLEAASRDKLGRIVLARGELHDHTHAIRDKNVMALRIAGAEEVDYFEVGGSESREDQQARRIAVLEAVARAVGDYQPLAVSPDATPETFAEAARLNDMGTATLRDFVARGLGADPDSAILTHEYSSGAQADHLPVFLAPGSHGVIRQREYVAPQIERRVVD